MLKTCDEFNLVAWCALVYNGSIMIEISELQRKRAENIIWNCARSYSFTSDFKAYDKDGSADIYWNCIIGAVRKHYDYSRFEPFLHSLSRYEDSDTYEGLFWLGLENCVYFKELADRPVLGVLRRRYAEEFVGLYSAGMQTAADDYHLLDALSLAHWQRVLGQTPKLSRYDIALLDELEFSPELDSDEIAAKAEAIFAHLFSVVTEDRKREKKGIRLLGIKKRSGKSSPGRYRKFGIGIMDRTENGGAAAGGQIEQNSLNTKLSASEVREFIETKYGKPMFNPLQTAELERNLCSGDHVNCHLHFTHGERIDAAKVQNAFEALSRQKEAAQVEANRKYYSDNIVRNKTAISKLSSKISNSILLHLMPSPVKSGSGALNSGRVWRALYLDDEKVFTKIENGNLGDLSVDLLLDASTSQKSRQEIISSQAYIIAESMTRCGIPCRIMSFCSMTGYTILRIFRDYNRPEDNSKVFEYVSNGCNRDGLAIKSACELIKREHYENRILMILSDVKPNDVIRIHDSAHPEGLPYESDAGIKNTAKEVRCAVGEGINVLCIFTGTDDDLPAAKLVYGRDFVRIRSFDMLADTVASLIQSCIRNL